MDLLTILEQKPTIQNFWHEWFNAYRGREVFQDNNRVFMTNPTAFLDYIEDCKGKHAPCWMTVQPFKNRDEVASIEKLYFDFDSENNLRKAWSEAKQFALMLKTHYNAEPLLCFSGNKGYNVYVWLANTVSFSKEQQHLAKQFYTNIQNMILKGLKLETLDHSVIGDIKRFSRVPYSMHQESKNPCLPITLSHQPLLVLSLGGFKHHGINENIVKFCLKKTDRKTKRKRYHAYVNENRKDVRPCIQTALSKDLELREGHAMRIAVTAEFLSAGYKPKEVAALFQSQGDYAFQKSLFYVEDIEKRHYKPFKCSTIKRLGFCLGEKCPIFKGGNFDA